MNSFLATSFVLLIFLSLHHVESKTKCQRVIPRQEWESERAIYAIRTYYIPDLVIIHHSSFGGGCTTVQSCSYVMRALQYDDMHVKNISDIIFNFCIGTDYKIYEGRGWGRTGNHARSLNNRSIGVCIIGNPLAFPGKMETSLITFLRCARKKRLLSVNYKVITHRQVSPSSCPGDIIHNIVSKWPQFESNLSNLNIYLQSPPKEPYPIIDKRPSPFLNY